MEITRETVAYKLKNESDLSTVKKALESYKIKWKDDVYKGFAKGSYISDCARDQKLLTKYYTPILRRYVKLNFNNAIMLEKKFSYLSSPTSGLHTINYEMRFVKDDGELHPQSRELYLAIKDAKKALDTISKFLV